jgi:hypothetical protein
VRRWLVNLAVIVSLTLCVAVLVLWARGYWQADWVRYGRNLKQGPRTYECYGILVESGRVRLYAVHREGLDPPRSGSGWASGSLFADPTSYRSKSWERAETRMHLGVIRSYRVTERYSPSQRDIVDNVEISDWFLVLAAAVLPLWAWRRRRRYGPGRCQSCGYDLRATPQRCPECGADVAADVATITPERLG